MDYCSFRFDMQISVEGVETYWPSVGPGWCVSGTRAGRTPGQRGHAASGSRLSGWLQLQVDGSPFAPASPPTSPSHSSQPPALGDDSGRTKPDKGGRRRWWGGSISYHVELNTSCWWHISWVYWISVCCCYDAVIGCVAVWGSEMRKWGSYCQNCFVLFTGILWVC